MLCGRGHLLAVARGAGIYETDLERVRDEARYADNDRGSSINEDRLLSDLIANTVATASAAHEKASAAEVDHELNLLRFQFRDAKTWRNTLLASNLSEAWLRRKIARHLPAQNWIERQIALPVTSDECRSFYETHRATFAEPTQYRAAHIFIAAPIGTPPEIVDAKKRVIELVFSRLAHGEDFSELAAEISEDEATKKNGGDLGYFSASRMPPDFFAQLVKLKPGKTSAPIQTRLGFHIVILSDITAGRELTFEEARTPIAILLQNEKRQTALATLNPGAHAEWRRRSL
jgi:foldase protein PrsA